MGKNMHADYSALLYLILTEDNHIFVEDGLIVKLPCDKVEDHFVALHYKYSPDASICETNGFQELVAENIIKKMGVVNLYKHTSKVDKTVRIKLSLTPLLAQHRIHIKNSIFGKLLYNQLLSFPTGINDDAPDALNLGIDMFNKILMNRRMSATAMI
jgi:predicted phage terminase large subunit-like protein